MYDVDFELETPCDGFGEVCSIEDEALRELRKSARPRQVVVGEIDYSHGKIYCLDVDHAGMDCHDLHAIMRFGMSEVVCVADWTGFLSCAPGSVIEVHEKSEPSDEVTHEYRETEGDYDPNYCHGM